VIVVLGTQIQDRDVANMVCPRAKRRCSRLWLIGAEGG
jgi:hypothetical protein